MKVFIIVCILCFTTIHISYVKSKHCSCSCDPQNTNKIINSNSRTVNNFGLKNNKRLARRIHKISKSAKVLQVEFRKLKQKKRKRKRKRNKVNQIVNRILRKIKSKILARYVFKSQIELIVIASFVQPKYCGI